MSDQETEEDKVDEDPAVDSKGRARGRPRIVHQLMYRRHGLGEESTVVEIPVIHEARLDEEE